MASLSDLAHAKADHESDRKLWLSAHHGAPAFTLEDGQMLTREQREQAWELVWDIEDANERERAESRCGR